MNRLKIYIPELVSAAHILRLYERFECLDKDKRGQLRQETVDFASFVRILAHFRPTETNQTRDGAKQEPANSRTRKLKFAFQLYDQDRDGKISRVELLQVLRAMLGMQVTEEQLQSIAERAIQEADLDKDDAISFDEFRKSLEKADIDHRMSIRFLR
ncbi:calcineurin B homologous protein 2 isoform X4 [Siniperca chuatsi]|uniref:calcineurin B homologous protein 2 isoform X4 n=1 Tax=Siniperca chuatsi TaxID=119488 RepID=UPI001CE0C010|nr:calcineurin B homologous protein 2 isoform X4 [Siniperca chuatsi]